MDLVVAVPEPSREFNSKVRPIVDELERQNRGLLLVALRNASNVEMSGGNLIVTYPDDNVFAGRVRASQTFFRDVGEKDFK